MKQLFVLSAYNVGFGGTPAWLSLAGGGDATNSFSLNLFRLPMPVAGTFRNLGVASFMAHESRTFTLLKDNGATALTTSLSSSAITASDETHEVSFVAGEDVSIGFDGGSGAHDLAYTLELEAAQQVYGSHILSNAFADGEAAETPALGNCGWTGTGAVGSICAVAGTITAAYVKSYQDIPDAGTYTVALLVDSVLQDGSGGTVDTRVVLTGADTTGSASFTLPIAVQQKVVVRFTRAGVSKNVRLAVGLAFTPTNGESFMLVGGSNQTVQNYVWNKVEQSLSDITRALSIIGPRGLTAVGLYAEMRTGLSPGGVFPVALLRNGGSTAIAFSITYTGAVPEPGSGTGFAPFSAGDTITIGLSNSSSGQFHWGLAALHGGHATDEDDLPQVGPDADEREIHIGMDARGIWVRPDLLLRKGLVNDPGPRSLPIWRGQ